MQLTLPLKPVVEVKTYGMAVFVLAGLAFIPSASFQSAIKDTSLDFNDKIKDNLLQIERTDNKYDTVGWNFAYQPRLKEPTEGQGQGTSPNIVSNSKNEHTRSTTLENPANLYPSGEEVVKQALTWQGVPYLYGGKSRAGIDCSALVQNVFRQFKIELPRTSSEQFRQGIGIPSTNLVPGDLVFFSTNGAGVSHVGIYIGGRNFVSATRNCVEAQSLDMPYWKNTYRGSRRVLT